MEIGDMKSWTWRITSSPRHLHMCVYICMRPLAMDMGILWPARFLVLCSAGRQIDQAHGLRRSHGGRRPMHSGVVGCGEPLAAVPWPDAIPKVRRPRHVATQPRAANAPPWPVAMPSWHGAIPHRKLANLRRTRHGLRRPRLSATPLWLVAAQLTGHAATQPGPAATPARLAATQPGPATTQPCCGDTILATTARGNTTMACGDPAMPCGDPRGGGDLVACGDPWEASIA